MRDRLDLLMEMLAARGLRVVPPDPSPDFPVVPFACKVRPARCADCAVSSCSYGETPGLAHLTEETYQRVAPKRRRSRGIVEAIAECPFCRWTLTTPDPEAAQAALDRHLDLKHGTGGDEPDGIA